jgi:hypothetical protein
VILLKQSNPLSELPEGFAMALAANVKALEVFSAMSDGEKRRVLDGTHALGSKADMQAYVARLAAQ